MDRFTTDTVVATSTAVTGSSLASIVIFNDTLYLGLAIISGFIGLLSSLNDLDELKKLNYSFKTFFIAFKGAFIGFFSAPMMMSFLVLFGDQLIAKMGFVPSDNLLIVTLYFGISILFSRVIIMYIFKLIERGRNDKK